jgi:hypothetical protein
MSPRNFLEDIEREILQEKRNFTVTTDSEEDIDLVRDLKKFTSPPKRPVVEERELKTEIVDLEQTSLQSIEPNQVISINSPIPPENRSTSIMETENSENSSSSNRKLPEWMVPKVDENDKVCRTIDFKEITGIA